MNNNSSNTVNPPVLTINEADITSISLLLKRYQLKLVLVDKHCTIPGSFWGDPEAGLIGNRLYARPDTPVHSLLHEMCHYICMDTRRRSGLNTNAGGDYDEENAVCFLQIILAEQIKNLDKPRIMRDMDSWGYTFRLGSTARWFDQDADDAKQWLIDQDLLDSHLQTTFNLRSE